MERLANDSTVKEFQQKIRDAQKENEELASRLGKKERECEVKAEEQVTLPELLLSFLIIRLNFNCSPILCAVLV